MTVCNRPLATVIHWRYTIPGYPDKPSGIPTNNHTNENEKERVMAGAEFGKVEVDIVYCVP